jgi:hypothetical protein
MNRRDFVSRVALGAAAACTNFARPAGATTNAGLKVRFVGMMTFVERTDHSFLVATPGQHGMHHMVHVPFLMARANTPIAKAFGMTPAPRVIPAAFDTELDGSRPSDFVYRNLENTSIEIVGGTADAVTNKASQMAHLHKIAPGKRVRGNLEKWAPNTVSLRGGRIENSAAHPDAGKTWRFGAYQQRLTDAVNYYNTGASIRLTSATEASSLEVGDGQSAELWLISAAIPESRDGNPNRLIHSELVFEYLVDAKAVLAECDQATGREVPATEIPFARPTSASLGTVASAVEFPPMSELCFICDILLGHNHEENEKQ